MAYVKGSAEKRQRQSEVRRLRNRKVRSEVRTEIRKFLEAVESKNKEKAAEGFLSCQKLLDSAARKGVYHMNTTARKKSRLHAKLNALA
ncbi:MAG: 30S ribosomal protein S20 [Spirochaetales bacterium]|nr:30S ribosomal protein S20 [Spirochaetales bacterium]